jgi:hypothetical protein
MERHPMRPNDKQRISADTGRIFFESIHGMDK